MSSGKFRAAALALGLAICNPSAVLAELESGIRIADAKVSIPPEQKVGTVKAGLICMPKGTLRLADFVDDERDFSSRLQRAVDYEVSSSSFPRLSSPATLKVTLWGMKANLCAKSWGVYGTGDTKSLSGTARFTFSWKLENGAILTENAEEVVELKIDKSGAASSSKLLDRALAILANRIVHRTTK